jgi:hypothetical protein
MYSEILRGIKLFLIYIIQNYAYFYVFGFEMLCCMKYRIYKLKFVEIGFKKIHYQAR